MELNNHFDNIKKNVIEFHSLGVENPTTFQVEVSENPITIGGETKIYWARFNDYHFLLKKLTYNPHPFELGTTTSKSSEAPLKTTNKLKTTFVFDEGLRDEERFIRTAKLIQDLDDDRLVYIPGIWRSNDDMYIPIEAFYLPGEDFSLDNALTMDNLITNLSLDERLSSVKQLAELINWLKLKQIYHFDLKLGNILWINNTVKLIDFGICVDRRTDIDIEERLPDPKLNNMIGTTPYLSPERILFAKDNDEKIDFFASEIYSLGIVFFEILTGQRLFQQNDTFAIINAIEKSDFENTNKLQTTIFESGIEDIPNISSAQKSWLKLALKLLLNKDPEVRVRYFPGFFLQMLEAAFG